MGDEQSSPPVNGVHNKRGFRSGKGDEEARIELVNANQTSSSQAYDGDSQRQNPSPDVLRDALAKRYLYFQTIYIRVVKRSGADTTTEATFPSILQEKMQVLRLCGAISTPHLQLPCSRYGMEPLKMLSHDETTAAAHKLT